MQLLLLLQLLLVMTTEVSSEDHWTCEAVKLRPTESLQHCKFQRSANEELVNETTTLFCDLLIGGKNHPEVVSFAIYIHVHYVISMASFIPVVTELDDDGDSFQVCFGYVDVVYEKLQLDDVWTNATLEIYTTDDYTILTALQTLRAEMTFDAQVPVGFLVLDRKCWQQADTRNESCLLDVRMLKEVLSPTTGVSPINGTAFTTTLRELYVETLHGEGEKLYVDISPYISTLTETYVFLLMENAPFRFLTVSGGQWGTLRNILPFQPRLQELKIINNNIHSISEGIFGNAWNLLVLDLSNNKLTSLPDDLGQLYNLFSLDLSGNVDLLRDNSSVVNISLILQDLQSLLRLSLRSVKMKRLDVLGPILSPDSGSKVKLTYLNVSNCGLESLPSFRFQTELMLLDLSGNQLQNVDGADLHLLMQLSTLILAGNRISGPLKLDLSADVIVTLDLSGNRIKDPADVVVSRPVETFDLSRNVVSNWTNATAFNGYETVNLSYNVISGMSDVMCQSLSVVDQVDLGGNVFNCDDCRMPVLQEWLRGNSTEVLNLGTDAPLTCSLPEVGVPVEEYPFNEELCLEIPPDLRLVVGVPVAIVVVFALLGSTLLYKFRFEVKYLFRRSLWQRKTKDRDGDYSYDAFVSYSGSDRWWVVDKLCPNMELSADKYKLCLHERDFALGSLVFDNIEASMRNSRFMIVVLSNNFLESQWCRWELDMANRQLFSDDHDFLILVQLEPLDMAKFPKRLSLLMDTQVTVVWPSGRGNNTLSLENQVWCRLRQAIGSSLYSYRHERSLMMALNA